MERPSDITGLIYIPFQDNIAKEAGALPPVIGPLIMRVFSVLGSLNQSVLPAVSLKITSARA